MYKYIEFFHSYESKTSKDCIKFRELLTSFIKNEDIGLILPIISVLIAFTFFVSLVINATNVDGSQQSDALIIEPIFSWMHVLENFVGGVVGVAAGVGIPLFIYWHRIKDTKKKEILRLCRSLHEELIHHINMLDGEEYRENHVHKPPDISYRIIYFSTEVFDSIVHSGLFLSIAEFEKGEDNITLLGIADLYLRIKEHNDLIAYRIRHRDLYYANNKDKDKDKRKEAWEEEFEHYEKYLTELENQIRVHTVGIRSKVGNMLRSSK